VINMSSITTFPAYTAFEGHRHLACGSLASVALAVKRASEHDAARSILVFDNTTGRTIDIDLRGADDEIVARIALTANEAPRQDESEGAFAPKEERGRGRPKLGVVAREVTLLPRHWDWLAAQPGGASVTLRKLVDDARRANGERESRRSAQERAYHFMSAIAGDFSGFEESTRALFAGDRSRFNDLTASWPADIRDHAVTLGFGVAP
jgi:hypothetical protein